MYHIGTDCVAYICLLAKLRGCWVQFLGIYHSQQNAASRSSRPCQVSHTEHKIWYPCCCSQLHTHRTCILAISKHSNPPSLSLWDFYVADIFVLQGMLWERCLMDTTCEPQSKLLPEGKAWCWGPPCPSWGPTQLPSGRYTNLSQSPNNANQDLSVFHSWKNQMHRYRSPTFCPENIVQKCATNFCGLSKQKPSRKPKYTS